MISFDATLKNQLDAVRKQNLFRQLRRVDSAQGPLIHIGDQAFLNFSSNDYLGLANHPALKEASIKAVEKYGAGAGASRLICGSLQPFHELEETLAAFKKTEAALSFSTGYAAALGTITALMGKSDILILDKLVHACIVDAGRLAGAKLRIFDHNDLNDLEDKLKWASQIHLAQNPEARTLIVTESIFSMDGDAAPLREIVALKKKYGAWLMVDEAHATGVLGTNGRGLADQVGVNDQIEVQMGTLGKALGASGGYICGSKTLIDLLINRARSFIFSTAPVPAAAAAASTAIKLAQSAEGNSRRAELAKRRAEFHASSPAAIVPLVFGDEAKAVAAANRLREQHIYVPAIRYPTVARGAARLRITLTAAHSADDVATLARVLEPIFRLSTSLCH